MKFWIITPTYNRYNILKKNIISLQNQSYKNYTHIIIDDSTNLETFNNIKKDFKDKNIKYFKNKKNRWVNYSRNFWLDNLGSDIDYIIYLDDDDYFHKNTLLDIKNILENNKNINWLITNHKNITKWNKYIYNYEKDYLFRNNLQWDATHILKYDRVKNIKFSKIIKNWFEFIYWLEVWKNNKIYYFNIDSTNAEYQKDWLTNTVNYKEKRNNVIKIFFELKSRKLINLIIILYLISIYIHNFKTVLKIKIYLKEII